MKLNRILALSVCLFAAGGSLALRAQDPEPDGRGDGIRGRLPVPPSAPSAWNQTGAQAGPGGQAGTNAIAYHGGPVMLGTTHIYYILYGTWTDATAKSILTDFASTIGGSSYYNSNTTYYSGSNPKNYISKSAVFGSAYPISAYLGTSLSDSQIRQIVSDAITSGKLPSDSTGVYFVLTSQDVNATSGFCTKYCGWHTHASIGGVDIKYSFVGNAARCPSACSAQTVSPNGNAGMDAMASIIAHELEESVTDPDLNAWYDRTGAENGDKCAWTFGTTSTNPNGSKYNIILGARQYLIQQNWLNIGSGSCVMTH